MQFTPGNRCGGHHNEKSAYSALALFVFICASAICLFSEDAVAREQGSTIRIVLSKPGEVYDRFATSFSKNIHDAHPAIPVEIRVLGSMDLKQDTALPPAVYVPVGVSATKALIQQKTATPLIAALVPDGSFRILQSKGSPGCRTGKLCSAIVLDQPPHRQLSLIRKIFGNNVKAGIIAGKINITMVNRYLAAANRAGVSIEIEKIATERELMPALEKLLKRTDMLLAIPDPVVFNANTVKHILLTTYRYRRPVTAFSPGYVKAGALASVYSSPEDAAQDLSDWFLNNWFVNDKKMPSIITPTSFSIELNDWVARSLDITMPEVPELRDAIGEGFRK